jgi:tetratricopeptide (TPR) repeat protein
MIPVLQKALKSHPGEKALMELLLLAYLKTGQNNRAMDQMKEMLKSRPKDLDLLLKLARLQDKQGITKEAAESYRKILNLSAEHKEAKASYIRLLLEQADDHEAKGNVKEALALYKEIMERSPGHEKAEEAYLRLRLQGIAQ